MSDHHDESAEEIAMRVARKIFLATVFGTIAFVGTAYIFCVS